MGPLLLPLVARGRPRPRPCSEAPMLSGGSSTVLSACPAGADMGSGRVATVYSAYTVPGRAYGVFVQSLRKGVLMIIKRAQWLRAGARSSRHHAEWGLHVIRCRCHDLGNIMRRHRRDSIPRQHTHKLHSYSVPAALAFTSSSAAAAVSDSIRSGCRGSSVPTRMLRNPAVPITHTS